MMFTLRVSIRIPSYVPGVGKFNRTLMGKSCRAPKQILWIEEAAVLKQGSGNGFGVRMQDPLFEEEAAFVGFARFHM
jgi:hypothetical protein